MKKILFAALVCFGLAGQSMAQTTVFSDSFNNLSQWTPKPGGSYAAASGGVLSFSQPNSGGDIYTTQAFTANYLNFDYLGMAGALGGGFVGVVPTVGVLTNWVAGAYNTSYMTGVVTTLVNDDTWHHYSILFGSGHISVEQFANNSAGQFQFRNMSLSDAPIAAVPEPETYAMLLAGLGLMGAVVRRRRQ